MIQQSHALAYCSLRRSTIISPRAAFANYWEGLIENNKNNGSVCRNRESQPRDATNICLVTILIDDDRE